MRKRRLKGILYCSLALIVIEFPTYAKAENEAPFAADRLSLQVLAGALYSPFTSLFPEVPDLDYFQTNMRLGWMLDSPGEGSSLLRGNYEAVFELTNSYVFKGAGSFISGFNALVRYNFVQRDAWVVPYVQTGAGIAYNDVYKDRNQRAVGQAVEFLLNLSVGMRFLLAENWSIDAEGIYQHISNAGLADRNEGNNAIGGLLGFTCYF